MRAQILGVDVVVGDGDVRNFVSKNSLIDVGNRVVVDMNGRAGDDGSRTDVIADTGFEFIDFQTADFYIAERTDYGYARAARGRRGVGAALGGGALREEGRQARVFWKTRYFL